MYEETWDEEYPDPLLDDEPEFPFEDEDDLLEDWYYEGGAWDE